MLIIYELPYDPEHPVVCMDETCKQPIGEARDPLPCEPGKPARVDDEYVRNGVAEIFLEVEPLADRRHVEVTERRTKTDWAWWIKGMLDERYPDAMSVRLVRDKLNTHSTASLYETFPPEEPAGSLKGLRFITLRSMAAGSTPQKSNRAFSRDSVSIGVSPICRPCEST